MSIPVLNKIKILSQISPHLTVPPGSSPPNQTHGPILAVEGMDPTSVHSMTHSLAEQLEKDGKFAVRIFSGPDPYPSLQMGGGGVSSTCMTTASFLETISEWHKISKDMVTYVTGRPRSESRKDGDSIDDADKDTPVGGLNGVLHLAQIHPTPEQIGRIDPPVEDPLFSAVSPKTVTGTADLSLKSPTPRKMSTDDVGSNVKLPPLAPLTKHCTHIPVTAIAQRESQAQSQMPSPPPPRLLQQPQTLPAEYQDPPNPSAPCQTQPGTEPIPTAATPRATAKAQAPPIPVALVPHYQLTTVDASSVSLPITDSYSPLAHWQWLATLWRGCVGPDVTIVIKGTEPDHAIDRTSPHGVEVRLLDYQAVVVRTTVMTVQHLGIGGDGSSTADDVETWEKAKRRVGFEVEEFLRR